MSHSFFAFLGIPVPTFNLGIDSGGRAVQTARVMERVEPIVADSCGGGLAAASETPPA